MDEEDLEEMKSSDSASKPDPEAPSHLFGQKVDKLDREKLMKILNLYHMRTKPRETKARMVLMVAELEKQIPEQACKTIAWLLKTRKMLTRNAIDAGIVEEGSLGKASGTATETTAEAEGEKSADISGCDEIAQPANAEAEGEKSADTSSCDEIAQPANAEVVKDIKERPIEPLKKTSPREQLLCKLCDQKIPLNMNKVNSSCGHNKRLCKECVLHAIATRIEDRKDKHFECPFPECTQELNLMDVMQFIGKKVFGRHEYLEPPAL